jgi:hypothetical protein
MREVIRIKHDVLEGDFHPVVTLNTGRLDVELHIDDARRSKRVIGVKADVLDVIFAIPTKGIVDERCCPRGSAHEGKRSECHCKAS